MSLSENDLIESISNSGEGGRAPIGWEAKVFHTICDERAQVDAVELRIVRDDTSQAAVSEDKPFGVAGLWPASGLVLAAAVALFFFGVREQRRNSHFEERKATISTVVKFVGLETEMTRQLVEIDLEEARMDEAFHELRVARLDASQAQLPKAKSSKAKPNGIACPGQGALCGL